MVNILIYPNHLDAQGGTREWETEGGIRRKAPTSGIKVPSLLSLMPFSLALTDFINQSVSSRNVY